MQQFIITLRHNGGMISIETWVGNAAQAANNVLDFEGAPVSAIMSIVERDRESSF